MATMVTNNLQNIFFMTEERNLYRFRTTWGRVYDDRIQILG